MPKDHEIFLDFVTNVFGREETILRHPCPQGGPDVTVFVYRDVPEKGMITGVTYGLSQYSHPEWKLGRPELFVSAQSADTAWAFAAAYFAAEFRGIKRFCYGDIFTLGEPIAKDSKMDGFLVFAQSLLDTKDASLQLNDWKVHFSQLYPIYRSELARPGELLETREF